MRVLMIRSNPVRPDSRVEKEAYTLIKGGHVVTILCWDRDSNHKACLEKIVVTGVEIPIIRIGYQAGFGMGKKSLIPFMQYQMTMCRWLFRNREKYDIIHACDFDMAFFSFKIAKLFKKKFVFDIFDFVAGEPKNSFQKIVKRKQFDIINRADATIICTEERIHQIKGSTPRQLAVVHNSPFAELMNCDGKVYQLNKDKVSVAYVGILQDFRLLPEIGQYFEKHPEYEWHIGGFGKYHEYFVKLSERAENIKYYGRIAYEETLALENACDIMLAIYDPSVENHRYAAPNKFYEALMLGKPLLMVKGTGMSDVVEHENIGRVIEYSEKGFAEGMQQLMACNAEWNSMKERMQCLYREKYSWDIMRQRLLDVYEKLSGGNTD